LCGTGNRTFDCVPAYQAKSRQLREGDVMHHDFLEFLEKAMVSVDIGEAFDIVCLDFAKAFD
jgi:hypothetical protein